MSAIQTKDYLAYRNNAVTNTKILVKAGPTDIRGVTVYNPGASAAFLQTFDKAATGDVTLGTTVPDEVFLIPASGQIVIEPKEKPHHSYSLGLVIAATSTAGGAAAPASNQDVLIKYL